MADASLETLKDHHAATQEALMPLVHETCLRFPGAKGDYGLLVTRVWHDYYGIPMPLIKKILQAPSPEAIARSYRRCAERWPDDCLPTEPTILKRRKYGKVYREYFKRQPLKPIRLEAFL